ncbi:protein GVQW3-like [Ooceraea biroi]|uniref:protein GVQW3-like n=1 Tax=Ooceraea biroi TaxID=2015173 RepID=UPI0005B7E739|nr:protein GVQW3-like [Ooceraea biroi]
MTERVEQRICIKFCHKLGYKCNDTIRMIRKVFGDDSMSESQIFVWFKRFKDGRVSVDNESSRFRTRTAENVERVRVAINENRRLTARELVKNLGIAKTILYQILAEDLGMSHVTTKYVPRVLTQEQKDFRVEVAEDILESIKKDPELLKRVITGDEMWVYNYDPETEARSKQESRPETACQSSWSNVKTMLTVFFDQEGVVHHEYAPQGRTKNMKYYLAVLKRLRDAVSSKRPLWKSGNWLLHHDNAQSSHLIQDFLTKHGIVQLCQPPSSPDIAPCDFWLFSKLKHSLKDKRCDDIEELKRHATTELLAIATNDFENCFLKWVDRWEKVVASKGEYCENDSIHITLE